jgi:hypothetical protein
MEKEEIINILDYTEYPGLRYKEQGEDSGEDYYYKILKPAFESILQKSQLKNNKYKLIVNLDDTAGYASSFLDEAFGNLTYDFGSTKVKEHLNIISNQEPDWIDVIFNETIPQWQLKKDNNISRKPIK